MDKRALWIMQRPLSYWVNNNLLIEFIFRWRKLPMNLGVP